MKQECRTTVSRIWGGWNCSCGIWNYSFRCRTGSANRVTAIIQQCIDGVDPEVADYAESCSGSCSTCGGCG
ncbi:MAG: hypothetical protein II550_07670 [Ruminococcus sp.]|nr:hypothetical protein [Ruminococcus sp.]